MSGSRAVRKRDDQDLNGRTVESLDLLFILSEPSEVSERMTGVI